MIKLETNQYLMEYRMMFSTIISCQPSVSTSKLEQLMLIVRPLSSKFGIQLVRKDSKLSPVVITRVLMVSLSLMISPIVIHSLRSQSG